MKTDIFPLRKTDFVNFFPRRELNAHKGSFGHALIIAGSRGYHGAAVLAGIAAVKSGVGLVTICTQKESYLPVASQLRQQMVDYWEHDWRIPQSVTSVLIGPGLVAAEIPSFFWNWITKIWVELPIPIVADASALDRIPPGATGGRRIITPHPGEAKRCLKLNSISPSISVRAGYLRQLSEKYGGCSVVLKGHHTLIGDSLGKIFMNFTGNPDLAQGGAGDILSGYMAGLLAQPLLQKDIVKTVSYATWRHGYVSDILSAQSKERQDNSRWVLDDLLKIL